MLAHNSHGANWGAVTAAKAVEALSRRTFTPTLPDALCRIVADILVDRRARYIRTNRVSRKAAEAYLGIEKFDALVDELSRRFALHTAGMHPFAEPPYIDVEKGLWLRIAMAFQLGGAAIEFEDPRASATLLQVSLSMMDARMRSEKFSVPFDSARYIGHLVDAAALRAHVAGSQAVADELNDARAQLLAVISDTETRSQPL